MRGAQPKTMELFESVVVGSATLDETRTLLRLYISAMPYKEEDTCIISNCVNECEHELYLQYLLVILSTACENAFDVTLRWQRALGLKDTVLIHKTMVSWGGIIGLKDMQRDMAHIVSESKRLFKYHQFCLRC